MSDNKCNYIKIRSAFEHNLKNVSVNIPLYHIVGITGVSGSGKSTIMKYIIAATGYGNYAKIQAKTIQNALRLTDFVKSESVSNVPLSVLIPANNSITNTFSTVATVSGIQEILRNLFTGFGTVICPHCGKVVNNDLSLVTLFGVDLLYDNLYHDAIQYIKSNGALLEERYYNNKNKPLKSISKQVVAASIYFHLNKPSDTQIAEFNRKYNCSIYVSDDNYRCLYDPLLFYKCECGEILPHITRSRLSFVTPYEQGGGACRKCGGSGFTVRIDPNQMIDNPEKGILNGGIRFVNDRGIRYTDVTELFIKAAADFYHIDLNIPVKNQPRERLLKLLVGTGDIITFTDRVGGKKSLEYKGICGFLCDSYLKGRGKNALSGYCVREICDSCQGLRIDRSLQCFQIFGKTFPEILTMNFLELREFVTSCLKKDISSEEKIYLERLQKKCNYFCELSCGHLSLGRNSNTLSGGEIQRLRICAMINADLSQVCYLLDEPSSGLHAQEIGRVGQLLKALCAAGNSVIIVDHNPVLLRFCDYIVDMGPAGGKAGGNILISDYAENIGKYNTATANLLSKPFVPVSTSFTKNRYVKEWLSFTNLCNNNLKHINIQIPKERFTVICGISGSGKSTLLRDVIYNSVYLRPENFGFDAVSFLGQVTSGSSISSVATLLELSDQIARIYAAQGKQPKNWFVAGSKEGKCPVCGGKGIILSENNEFLGVCDACEGRGFSDETLSVRVGGLNIDELLHTPLDQLSNLHFSEKVSQLSKLCDLLGIGYLTLSRKARSLSTGELQRVKLAASLLHANARAKISHQLYLLDEPSKGLHDKDAGKLAEAIHLLVNAGNTVIAVEHNAHLIAGSDYLIELGGTGSNGGYLLYSGSPDQIYGTPTADLLHGNYSVSKDQIPALDKPYYNSLLELPSDKAEIRAIAKKTVDDYLSVVIPNNIFFSKAHSTSAALGLPYLQVIDFSEPIHSEISIYSALGIKETVISYIYEHYPHKADLYRYVFNDESPTGKCSCCHGNGSVQSICEDYFLIDGKLSAACKKFLSNGTCYVQAKKILKKEIGIDIGTSLQQMDANTRKVLFWGTDHIITIYGKASNWDGIIPLFLKNHKYYPDKSAGKAYASREKISCPVCHGKMIKEDFHEILPWNFSYEELQHLHLQDIANQITAINDCAYSTNRMKQILITAIHAGLGEHFLGESLSTLSPVDCGLIKCISFYFNGLYKTCIIFQGLEMLDNRSIKFVKTLADDIKRTNEVIFN